MPSSNLRRSRCWPLLPINVFHCRHRCHAAAKRQQRTGAADTMVKSCSGERLKRSILVNILLNKEPSLVAGLSQQLFCGDRNPQESRGFWGKYRNSFPQEFLQKIPVTVKKTGILATFPKPRSCEKFLRKTQGKKDSSGILARTFFCPTNKFLKTGITNLAPTAFTPQKLIPMESNDTVQNFSALCVADGTSDHRRNHIKLQMVDE
jgi:hypothetical protein